MCTLSWVYHGNTHYEIYFNRDEQRARLPAIEPQNLIIDGVKLRYANRSSRRRQLDRDQ